MKAMIFAAGLGTRLQPLTNDKPKALVEINGKTLLEITIERLALFGFTDILINVHHFADKMTSFIQQLNYSNVKLSISDERDELLDTGGGLLKAKDFFNDQPFLVHNVDVLSDIDLTNLYYTHFASNALATLAVRDRSTSRYFLFNSQLELCGWENKKTNEQIIANNQSPLQSLAFSGIQVVSPEIFDVISQTGKFSITQTYLQLAQQHVIKGYDHTQGKWLDVGKHEALELAKSF